MSSAAREIARWAAICSGNRLVNPDPHTWLNTGQGGFVFSPDYCTPHERVTRALKAISEMRPPMAPKCPLFVEACAGTAALSLRLQGGPTMRPPVSRMGSKVGYAQAILWVLGLRQGEGAGAYLWAEPDDGARLMLQVYPQPELLREAAEIIRGWVDEVPNRSEAIDLLRRIHKGVLSAHELHTRANKLAERKKLASRWLWERLRAEGPIRGADGREVARWLSSRFLSYGQDEKRGFRRSAGGGWPDRAPDVSTVADRLDGADSAWPSVTIVSDALDLNPADWPRGTIVYVDPPYQGTTGYADDLPREKVLAMAELASARGHVVCISEAEPLPLRGWHHVEITNCRRGQKRTFSKQKREWLTLNREPAWRPAEQVPLFGEETAA